MIPDSIPFALLILTVFLGPVIYGRTKTPAVPTSRKEASK